MNNESKSTSQSRQTGYAFYNFSRIKLKKLNGIYVQIKSMEEYDKFKKYAGFSGLTELSLTTIKDVIDFDNHDYYVIINKEFKIYQLVPLALVDEERISFKEFKSRFVKKRIIRLPEIKSENQTSFEGFFKGERYRYGIDTLSMKHFGMVLPSDEPLKENNEMNEVREERMKIIDSIIKTCTMTKDKKVYLLSELNIDLKLSQYLYNCGYFYDSTRDKILDNLANFDLVVTTPGVFKLFHPAEIAAQFGFDSIVGLYNELENMGILQRTSKIIESCDSWELTPDYTSDNLIDFIEVYINEDVKYEQRWTTEGRNFLKGIYTSSSSK